MTRRTLLSAFAALFVTTIAMLIGSTVSVSAQQSAKCCQYTIDIRGIPNACFPFRVATQWDCGGGPFTVIDTYGTNNIFVIPLGPPNFPPCPPACRFLGASLDNSTFIPPGQTGTFQIGHCCYVVRVGFDANGCPYILIRPC